MKKQVNAEHKTKMLQQEIYKTSPKRKAIKRILNTNPKSIAEINAMDKRNIKRARAKREKQTTQRILQANINNRNYKDLYILRRELIDNPVMDDIKGFLSSLPRKLKKLFKASFPEEFGKEKTPITGRKKVHNITLVEIAEKAKTDKEYKKRYDSAIKRIAQHGQDLVIQKQPKKIKPLNENRLVCIEKDGTFLRIPFIQATEKVTNEGYSFSTKTLYKKWLNLYNATKSIAITEKYVSKLKKLTDEQKQERKDKREKEKNFKPYTRLVNRYMIKKSGGTSFSTKTKVELDSTKFIGSRKKSTVDQDGKYTTKVIPNKTLNEIKVIPKDYTAPIDPIKLPKVIHISGSKQITDKRNKARNKKQKRLLEESAKVNELKNVNSSNLSQE